jgi:hypothetical protein
MGSVPRINCHLVIVLLLTDILMIVKSPWALINPGRGGKPAPRRGAIQIQRNLYFY